MEEIAEKKGRQGMEALLSIASDVQAQLQAEGIAAELAREIGLKAADSVRKRNGGTDLYIPKGAALVLSQRDWQIWRDFDGSNHAALAKAHDLTVRQIYTIVARVREEDFLKRQQCLF